MKINITGMAANGLRKLSLYADNLKPGDMLRQLAVNVDSISSESYSERIEQLTILEQRIKNYVTVDTQNEVVVQQGVS